MTGFRITCADVAALEGHSAARQTLAARGEQDAARGAANIGTVAALTLAATPAADGAALTAAIARLAVFVVAVEPDRRGFVAALIDAALAAQVEARAAAGLPPPGRRIDGWMAAAAAAAEAWPEISPPASVVSPRALARYAAAALADDVDAVLVAVIPFSQALVEAARRGSALDRHFDAVRSHALALCVRPVVTACDAEGVRNTAAILGRTLRRRRPLAAAILTARLRCGDL